MKLSRTDSHIPISISNTLYKVMKSVPKKKKKLHILTQLYAQENDVDFCHCKSFKTYIISDGLLLEMKAIQFIKMSGSTHPMT
jgi:hypothetical protein